MRQKVSTTRASAIVASRTMRTSQRWTSDWCCRKIVSNASVSPSTNLRRSSMPAIVLGLTGFGPTRFSRGEGPGRSHPALQARSALEPVATPLQVERPAALGADGIALALPTLAVAVEVAVPELHARAFAGLGDEADLHLAGFFAIPLDLPMRGDVPADYDPVRRLVGEDACPTALAPIHAPVINMTAHARLEHRLGNLDAEHVVLAWFDAIELLREDSERPLDGRRDDDLRVYGRLLRLRRHETSS